MMTVAELYRVLSEKIPASYSASFDNDGLSCCPDGTRRVRRVLVALDATEENVRAAVRGNYDVLLTHHPMIFSPLRALTEEETVPRKLLALVHAGVAAMAFHTRLDAIPGGVNDVLAELFDLTDVTPFGVAGEPLCGRVGNLPQETEAEDFAALVREKLRTSAVVLAGGGKIRRVAVLGGEGKDDIGAARAAGADLFLSGRLGYHRMLDAPEDGMCMIEAGHYATEAPVLCRLADWVRELVPEAEVTVTDRATLRFI